MRTLVRLVVCLGLLAAACGEGGQTPTRPAQIPSPSPQPPPAPAPFAFQPQFTQITVGEVVNRRVTADAPECSPSDPWPCQHFRLTAPSDGGLEVAMTYSVQTQPHQTLDLSFVDSVGHQLWGYAGGVPPELRVSVSVKTGAVYQITVWYTYPGVEFQLRTALQPGPPALRRAP